MEEVLQCLAGETLAALAEAAQPHANQAQGPKGQACTQFINVPKLHIQGLVVHP